jgi:hypothetical protein
VRALKLATFDLEAAAQCGTGQDRLTCARGYLQAALPFGIPLVSVLVVLNGRDTQNTKDQLPFCACVCWLPLVALTCQQVMTPTEEVRQAGGRVGKNLPPGHLTQ